MFQKLRQVLYQDDFARNGKASFEAHYAHIRAIVPADRLLEYHVSQEWEPLCKFLGRPVPEEDNTPFINQTAEIKARLGRMHMVNLKRRENGSWIYVRIPRWRGPLLKHSRL